MRRAEHPTKSIHVVVIFIYMLAVPLLTTALVSSAVADNKSGDDSQDRPNILFAIADDWGWPHAGAYGDLRNVLTSQGSGRVDRQRDFVLIGKERHVPSQEAPDMGGYPCRAIRTHQFLYIRNFDPDRWPSGTPRYGKAAIPGAWLADCDNGATKTYMFENREKDAIHRRLYDLAFGKRPAEELYDLEKDSEQLSNVADDPQYAEIRAALAKQLTAELEKSGDPRVVGGGDQFDRYPYLGGAPKFPGWRPPAKRK